MNVKIKRATLHDLKALQNLNNLLFKHEEQIDLDTYVEDWALGEKSKEYLSDLIENQFVIIAWCDEEAVGYLTGSIYQDDTYSFYEGDTCELESIFVRDEYRNLGIGSKMVNLFFEWCKSKKAKRCFVTAMLGNEKAVKFYRGKDFIDQTVTLKKEFNEK